MRPGRGGNLGGFRRRRQVRVAGWKPGWGRGVDGEPLRRAFRALGGNRLVARARRLGLSDEGIQRFVARMVEHKAGAGLDYEQARQAFEEEIADIDKFLRQKRRPGKKMAAGALWQRREYSIYLRLLAAFRR